MAYITRSRWNEIHYSIAYLVCQQFFIPLKQKISHQANWAQP